MSTFENLIDDDPEVEDFDGLDLEDTDENRALLGHAQNAALIRQVAEWLETQPRTRERTVDNQVEIKRWRDQNSSASARMFRAYEDLRRYRPRSEAVHRAWSAVLADQVACERLSATNVDRLAELSGMEPPSLRLRAAIAGGVA